MYVAYVYANQFGVSQLIFAGKGGRISAWHNQDKKVFATLGNIARRETGLRARATLEGEKKGEVFLIIHKNLDEFVTFRHLAGIKNKATTAGKW